jgi:hypothetical protein
MAQHFSRVRLIADDFCRSYINSREERLAAQDLLQVCSFNWGIEALEGIPGFESQPGSSQLEALHEKPNAFDATGNSLCPTGWPPPLPTLPFAVF